MVEKPNFDPKQVNKAEELKHVKSETEKPGTFHYKSMTFLGMHFTAEEAKKLWNTITQSISQAIDREKARALKALKRLKPGHEDDD